MKFERGQTVFVSSPHIVEFDGVLCKETIFLNHGQQDEVQFIVTSDGVYVPEGVFPSRTLAEAAGRAFVKQIMQEEREAFETKMGKLHKILKEER